MGDGRGSGEDAGARQNPRQMFDKLHGVGSSSNGAQNKVRQQPVQIVTGLVCDIPRPPSGPLLTLVGSGYILFRWSCRS